MFAGPFREAFETYYDYVGIDEKEDANLATSGAGTGNSAGSEKA